jgi:TonB family protein
MLSSLLLLAAAIASPDVGQSVESKNGEFIFSQYPPRALAAGDQGSVRFRAEVDAKGNVMKCKVTEGSGHKRLDRETCDMIVDHASFKPTLDSEGIAREAIHDGIVNWRISGVAPAATKVAGKSPDEVVCKRVNKTGSLVTHSRLCLTRRDWIRYAEQNQDRYGEVQGRFGSSREDQPTFASEMPAPGSLSGGGGPPR